MVPICPRLVQVAPPTNHQRQMGVMPSQRNRLSVPAKMDVTPQRWLSCTLSLSLRLRQSHHPHVASEVSLLPWVSSSLPITLTWVHMARNNHPPPGNMWIWAFSGGVAAYMRASPTQITMSHYPQRYVRAWPCPCFFQIRVSPF
jgi:hypothetical protein